MASQAFDLNRISLSFFRTVPCILSTRTVVKNSKFSRSKKSIFENNLWLLIWIEAKFEENGSGDLLNFPRAKHVTPR